MLQQGSCPTARGRNNCNNRVSRFHEVIIHLRSQRYGEASRRSRGFPYLTLRTRKLCSGRAKCDESLGSSDALRASFSVKNSSKHKGKSIYNSTAMKYDFRRTVEQAHITDDWRGIALPCSSWLVAWQIVLRQFSLKNRGICL